MTQTRAAGTPADLRILIVDDDRRVRQSLSGLIALRDRMTVVGTAATAEDALESIAAVVPDVVLLDLRLPEAEDGLAVLAAIRVRWPAIRVIAMSVAVELRTAALTAGADGFVCKSDQSEAIGDALAGLLEAAPVDAAPADAARVGVEPASAPSAKPAPERDTATF